MHTSPRVVTIAVTLGLSAWSAAQSAAAPRPSPTPSQAGQTTDAPPPAAQAQGDRPVFRGGVDLIQLDVSVLDRKRQPVVGLNASDFTVFENGVQRPVRAFTSIQLPNRTRHSGAADAGRCPWREAGRGWSRPPRSEDADGDLRAPRRSGKPSSPARPDGREGRLKHERPGSDSGRDLRRN